jgi:tetratricopeptide (TPR) repeat protein
MLNSDQLAKYLANPGLLSAWSMKEIQLLTDQYPFFQTARLLEVKNCHVAGSFDFKSKLNFCAAYVTDRKILFALINPWESKPASYGTSGKAERERKPTLQENIADVLVAQLDITRSLNPNEAELKPNIALDIKKEYGEAETFEEDKTDQATDNSLLWLDESEPVPVQSVVEEPSNALKIDEPADLIDLEDNITAEPILASGEMDADQQGETVSEKNEKLIPDAETSVSNHELINRFIETSPHLSPPAETDQPVDISADSIREDEGFLTDTLAKIYIKQGYYAKAIFAYEKLLLKFPEKSAYFAAQIEAIKNRMNKEE